MAESSNSQAQKPKLVEELLEAAKHAFDPSANDDVRKGGIQQYNLLINRAETWTLLPILNSLIKPDTLPLWLRGPLMQTLTTIPLRPDGVRGTLEFVFSVHPSNENSAGEQNEPQKSGASITHEAVALATKLLSSVPTSMTADAWYSGIAPQIFSLMDGQAGPELAKTAAQIVGFGMLGRKQVGAPGAPGWNAFVQPLISSINPSLEPTGHSSTIKEEDIIDLSRGTVLVEASSLAQALGRLKTLILSNPSPGLCRRVLKPIVPQLWTLASWPAASELTSREFCAPARQLLQTYLTLFGKEEDIAPLVGSLLCNGSGDCTRHDSGLMWRFQGAPGKGLEIVQAATRHRPDIDLTEIESKAASFVKIIATVCSNNVISSLFLSMLRSWIDTMQQRGGIQVKAEMEEVENNQSPINDLVRVTILQKLMDLSPEKLVSQFERLMDIICQVLVADASSSLGDDLLAVVLSLLNLVITSTSFTRSDLKPADMTLIEESLARIGNSDRDEVAATARNLATFLKYRDEVEPTPDEPISAPSLRQVEDRRAYSLAMEYITGDGDSPPPVVSEGLNILSTLIMAQSPILDINAVTVLMSTLLKENEDYINLRVIKIFTQLAAKHPKSTIKEILDNYLDAQEKYSTDIRLRFGEALLQVIERLGETFTGDTAIQTGEILLSIAGRRGYRPKTMAKLAREERLNKLKSKRTGDDSAEAENDSLMEDEEVTGDERADMDIIAQIVQGWESKRGSEDIRMRSSALSILGTALEINIAGVGPSIASNAVDLSVNVLAVERELEHAILRRSAIMMVLSFIRALSQAKESNRSLGFGLTEESREDIQRTLEYVAETDNDGLVRQHARDVVESLENWQAASMLPQPGASNVTSGLGRLAGLQVNPGAMLVDAQGHSRPRIEEVE